LRRIIVQALLFGVAVCPLTGQFYIINPGEIDVVNAASGAPAMTSTNGLAAGRCSSFVRSGFTTRGI